eukprot:TRINITY_DN33673_c0_g1_i1.p2 TRINITY_DN33673_c0_g1~~TRINITY_DN33673_c0_g1_i1.p2  ORF type:complete len:120 (+),score=22.76 TRINITY_DN33673_c0_g1_i1:439-798(+)
MPTTGPRLPRYHRTAPEGLQNRQREILLERRQMLREKKKKKKKMGRSTASFCSQGYKGCVSMPAAMAGMAQGLPQLGITDVKPNTTCQQRDPAYQDITAQLPKDFKIGSAKFFWKGDKC